MVILEEEKRHHYPLVWFDRLTTNGRLLPLILSLLKDMSGQ